MGSAERVSRSQASPSTGDPGRVVSTRATPGDILRPCSICWPARDPAPRLVRGRPRSVVTPDPPADRALVAPHEWRPARFMVIVAHPDDADFGPPPRPRGGSTRDPWAGSCAAPVATRAARTRRSTRWSWRPSARPSSAARPGSSDTTTSASCTSRTEPSPTGFRSGSSWSARSASFRPDALLTHDPEVLFYRGGGVNHTDHRAAGIAAVDAVYPAARNPMAFPNLVRAELAPHRVRRIYLFWPGGTDRLGSRLGPPWTARSRPCAVTPASSARTRASPSGCAHGPPRMAVRSARAGRRGLPPGRPRRR